MRLGSEMFLSALPPDHRPVWSSDSRKLECGEAATMGELPVN